MSFQTSKNNGVVVVDVDGQLIVGNRQELKQKVLDELEGGERKFLIDFSNTGYIDSSGLGVLGHDRPPRRVGLTPKDSSGSEAPRGA